MPPDPPRKPSTSDRLALALLIVAVLVLFGRIVNHPFVVYDDVKYILTNPLVVNPASATPLDWLLTPSTGYIIPVTVAIEALLYALGGGAPWAFHAASLTLHTLTTAGLFGFARRLGASTHAAALSTLAFALHPVVVEPVSWATGIKDLIMAPLALAATWCFFEASLPPSPHPDPTHPRHPQPPTPLSPPTSPDPTTPRTPTARPHLLVAALTLATLAALSKPTAVLIAAAWLAALAATRPPSPTTRPALITASLTLAIGSALALMSRFSHDTLLVADLDQAAQGHFQPLLALGHQLHHLAWPDHLHPIYRIDRTLAFSDWHTWLGAAALLAFSALTLSARRSPPLALTLILAAASFLPVSNILPFPRFMADSYLYLPLASLSLAASISLTRLLPHDQPLTRHSSKAAALVSLAIIAALALRAHPQVNRWTGGAALWQPLIDQHPDWPYAHSTLAQELHTLRKDSHTASRHFHDSFKVGYDPDALINYGVALARINRLDDAECVMVEATHHAPQTATARRNLAIFLADHPDRPPTYPQHATTLIHDFHRDASAGLTPWPPALLQGLATQASRLPPSPNPPDPWPQHNCDPLR